MGSSTSLPHFSAGRLRSLLRLIRVFALTLLTMSLCVPPTMAGPRRKKRKKPSQKSSEHRAFSHSARSYHYYIVGKTLSYQNRPRAAIQAFQQAILSDWDSPYLFLAVGKEYLQLKDYATARRWLERALKKSKKGHFRPLAEALYLLARIHWRQGDLRKAERCYRRAIRSRAGYLPPYNDLLALLAMKKNPLREQIRLSKRMIATAPSRYEGYLSLATYLEKSGKHWLSIRAYKKALQRNPSHRKARFCLARLYERQRRWSLALRSYELLLDYHPSHFKARVFAASVRLQRRARFDQSIARAQLRLLLRAFHTRKRTRKMRAVATLLLQRKLPGEARRWLVKVLQRRPEDVQTLWLLSDSWAQQGHYRMALKALQRIPAPRGSLRVRLLTRKLTLLFRARKIGTARRLLRMQLRQSRYDLKTRLTLSQQFCRHLSRKDLWREVVFFRKKLARFANPKEVQLHLSHLHTLRGEHQKSVLLLRKILLAHPAYVDALSALAAHYTRSKKHASRAEALLKRALKVKPTDGRLLAQYGWLLYHLGKLKRARRILSTAQSLLPGSVRILEHLGWVRQKMGHIKEALLLFDRARKKSSAKRIRKRLWKQILRLRQQLRSRREKPRKPQRSKAT